MNVKFLKPNSADHIVRLISAAAIVSHQYEDKALASRIHAAAMCFAPIAMQMESWEPVNAENISKMRTWVDDRNVWVSINGKVTAGRFVSRQNNDYFVDTDYGDIKVQDAQFFQKVVPPPPPESPDTN